MTATWANPGELRRNLGGLGLPEKSNYLGDALFLRKARARVRLERNAGKSGGGEVAQVRASREEEVWVCGRACPASRRPVLDEISLELTLEHDRASLHVLTARRPTPDP